MGFRVNFRLEMALILRRSLRLRRAALAARRGLGCLLRGGPDLDLGWGRQRPPPPVGGLPARLDAVALPLPCNQPSIVYSATPYQGTSRDDSMFRDWLLAMSMLLGILTVNEHFTSRTSFRYAFPACFRVTCFIAMLYLYPDLTCRAIHNHSTRFHVKASSTCSDEKASIRTEKPCLIRPMTIATVRQTSSLTLS